MCTTRAMPTSLCHSFLSTGSLFPQQMSASSARAAPPPQKTPAHVPRTRTRERIECASHARRLCAFGVLFVTHSPLSSQQMRAFSARGPRPPRNELARLPYTLGPVGVPNMRAVARAIRMVSAFVKKKKRNAHVAPCRGDPFVRICCSRPL